MWGTTVDGLGPASLYVSALTVPETASKVREVFADVLDSPSGRYAQLCLITDRLDYTDPAPDDNEHTARLRQLAYELVTAP